MQKSSAVLVFLGALLTGALSVSAAEPDALTADGGRYFGPLVGGKFHGRGRLEWSNGVVYEGDFAAGVMSGKGRMKWAYGNQYEGDFRNGEPNGKGRYQTANGSIYTGEMKDGEYSGRGRLEQPGDFTYEGDFEYGLFHGQGHYVEKNHEYRGGFKRGRYSGEGEGTTSDGVRYRGNHVDGRWEGKGRYENASKEVYAGDFKENEFTGKGVYTKPDGIRYEGEFLKWRFHGPGKYFVPDGGSYEGRFIDGSLQGRGKFTAKNGLTYDGGFKDWLYDGQGELREASGDVYKGGFQRGVFQGQGTLTLAHARGGQKQISGMWERGVPASESAALGAAKPGVDVETAIYTQRKLLDDALGGIAANDPSKPEMYVLAVAGDGSQEVFRREVEFVRKQFADRFGTGARTISLVNSRSTLGTMPMATVTSVGEAVKAIAAKMDKERDILFIYMSSHGAPELGLYLNQNNIQLRSLTPRALAAMLRESGIRWKVVVVSACYAGGFLYPLHDETTMVIAAARSDRKSFGCADENDFTYFGEAYFRDALPQSTSFAEAFEKARAIVEKREAEQQPKGEKPKEEEFSRPQMHNPEKVDAYLRKWWGQAAR